MVKQVERGLFSGSKGCKRDDLDDERYMPADDAQGLDAQVEEPFGFPAGQGFVIKSEQGIQHNGDAISRLGHASGCFLSHT